jgi:RNA polymerase sigma-70 factor (ECF subfamily)
MNVHTPVLKRLVSIAAAVGEVDWEALYLKELPHIYNFFRYRVGDGPVAEDLTARTFERAWRGRYQYRRDVAAFSTWLFTIARNVANDHFRQRRSHSPIEEAAEIPDPLNLEDEVIRRSQCARLSKLLMELPDRERELLALKYGSGMNNREIASLTGLSESNIGTILHRTIKSLRSRWDESEENHG